MLGREGKSEKEDKFEMDLSRRRVGVRGSVVAAGSVWESRMKSDEVRDGVKVFNGGEESAVEGGTRLKRNQLGGAVSTGKRKTWKSESPEGLEKSQIQIARGKTEPQKNCGEQCKDSDGIKKSPIQVRKLKSKGSKEIDASADKFERSPIHTRKLRSEVLQNGTSELRKSKSDSVKTTSQSDDGNGESSFQLRKTKSELDHVDGGCGKEVIENGKNDSDENCKDFGVCQEEVISSSSNDVGVVNGDSDEVIDGGEEQEEEEFDIEVEKRSFDVKEISIPQTKVVNEAEKQKVVNEPDPKKVVSTNRRFHHKNATPVSVPLTVKQSPSIRRQSTIYQNFSKANSSKVL